MTCIFCRRDFHFDTNFDPDNCSTIALEPSVFDALVAYAKTVWPSGEGKEA